MQFHVPSFLFQMVDHYKLIFVGVICTIQCKSSVAGAMSPELCTYSSLLDMDTPMFK